MNGTFRSHAGSQMLTFKLGAEVFGVDILRVQEIRGWSPVTRIPQTQGHVLGVLNLRGAVVPIIDLRLRFALADAAYNALTVIIVLSVTGPGGSREVGVVVDSVSEVVDVADDALRPAPVLGPPAATDFISGLLTLSQGMVILLDVDRLIGTTADHNQERAA